MTPIGCEQAWVILLRICEMVVVFDDLTPGLILEFRAVSLVLI